MRPFPGRCPQMRTACREELVSLFLCKWIPRGCIRFRVLGKFQQVGHLRPHRPWSRAVWTTQKILCSSVLRFCRLAAEFFPASGTRRNGVRTELCDQDSPNHRSAWVPVCPEPARLHKLCLLYTSDAADERSSVDLGGRRIIKKKTSL